MIGVGWGMFLYVSLLGAAKGMENGFDNYFPGLLPTLFSCGRRKHLFLMRDFLKEERCISIYPIWIC